VSAGLRFPEDEALPEMPILNQLLFVVGADGADADGRQQENQAEATACAHGWVPEFGDGLLDVMRASGTGIRARCRRVNPRPAGRNKK
jgi:hypothetical protein